ncbi:MAG TPA: sigma-70 family RNA polymerase sigma factor [Nocardioidaceae bacterium]|nr:sigma-70 family RNA polymerase sigma factor [Nocardioidaceae bacterium]
MRATDEAEFTEFVHATGTRLERAALLLTGDSYLAEDLVQATYAKVFAAWRRVKRDPLGYARSTLLHAYISHRRLRRNTELPTDQVFDTQRSAADHDPAARLDVLDALSVLPALDRAVVILRYWEDRSVADVAADLDLTEAVVRTRALRALRRLRPLLELDERTAT